MYNTKQYSDSDTLAQLLSDYVTQTNYSDLPYETIKSAKRFLLDALGCMIIGSTAESTKAVVDTVKFFGGKKHCSVISFGLKTSLLQAAWANSSMLHALELDDYHREGTVHPGCVIIPAALATAEYLQANGRALLLAIVLGYEVMIRIGEAFLGKSFLQGFQPTSTCGVFGAAATAGKLLGLDRCALRNALGIAGSHASGLREARAVGTWAKRIQPAHASMSGILSAVLASKGFTGPDTVLEGRNGFLKAFSHQCEYDGAKVREGLGSTWKISETSFKVHSCCRFASPIADSAIQIVNGHNLNPNEIENVHVETSRIAIDTLTNPVERKYEPKTLVDAQFSLPFVAAVAIIRGRASIADFSEGAICDTRILELSRKVSWSEDPEFTRLFPKCLCARVTVRTYQGNRYAADVPKYPKGDPENSLSDLELSNKFEMLTQMAGMKNNKDVENLVDKIELLQNVEVLMEQLKLY